MSEKKRSPKALHEPTKTSRAQVQSLATYGVPQDEIAAHVGIDPKTLRKHYRAELDAGAVQASVRVRRFLFEGASGIALSQNIGATYADCARLAMFMGKTRYNMRETTTTEVYDNTGKAPVNVEADLENMTDEELKEFIARIEKEEPNDDEENEDCSESGQGDAGEAQS